MLPESRRKNPLWREKADVLREQYSEFYRWSEDFQERVRLNREVEALLAEIRRVLDKEA